MLIRTCFSVIYGPNYDHTFEVEQIAGFEKTGRQITNLKLVITCFKKLSSLSLICCRSRRQLLNYPKPWRETVSFVENSEKIDQKIF